MYDELVKRLRELQAITEHCDEQSCGECENRELCDKHDNKTLSRTYKEAADAIEELKNNVEQYKLYLQDAIKDLQSAHKELPRWIPVTERLPETPGEYMIAYHPCYWDRVHDEIKVGLDSFRGKTSWAKKKYQRVTHWLPLPEPPKEE